MLLSFASAVSRRNVANMWKMNEGELITSRRVFLVFVFSMLSLCCTWRVLRRSPVSFFAELISESSWVKEVFRMFAKSLTSSNDSKLEQEALSSVSWFSRSSKSLRRFWNKDFKIIMAYINDKTISKNYHNLLKNDNIKLKYNGLFH